MCFLREAVAEVNSCTERYVRPKAFSYRDYSLTPSISLCLPSLPSLPPPTPDSLLLTQDGTIGPEGLIAAYKNPEMKTVLCKAAHLTTIDLELLDTPAKQVAFYSNVVNFLYAHAIMVFLASEQEREGEGEESGNNPLSVLSSSGISLAMMQSSGVVQATYFSRVGYHLGQLGLIRWARLAFSVLGDRHL